MNLRREEMGIVYNNWRRRVLVGRPDRQVWNCPLKVNESAEGLEMDKGSVLLPCKHSCHDQQREYTDHYYETPVTD